MANDQLKILLTYLASKGYMEGEYKVIHDTRLKVETWRVNIR
jgi:hypothetical protein